MIQQFKFECFYSNFKFIRYIISYMNEIYYTLYKLYEYITLI